jgi:hypothetical protein
MEDEMKARAFLAAGFLLLATLAHGQTAPSWPCFDDLAKSEGDTRKIRMSTGLSQSLAIKKVLPETSDLKASNVDATVAIQLIVDKSGIVRCARPLSGESSLFQRSIEAAQQWRFKPWRVNGEPLMVETQIEFIFERDKVKTKAW